MKKSDHTDGRAVLSLGLTPAWQRTLLFDRFTIGGVNRATDAVCSAAGKAVNVGLALAELGVRAIVTGCNGGDIGRKLAADLRRRGVTTRFTPMPLPTRICTTVLDAAGGRETELVEESPAVTAALWRHFERTNLRLLARCRLLIISGTLPPSLPATRYVIFAREAARRGVPLIIDSHREALLAVLPHRPLLAKLNAHELARTLGTACETEGATLKGMARLQREGAAWVLVTRGAQPALLAGPEGTAWRLTPPAIAPFVNPIGSGDCTTAGLAHSWLGGAAMPEAARFGLCCGSANVRTTRPADFSAALARRLRSRCRVEPLAR